MTENHAEDAPLLGGPEIISPTESQSSPTRWPNVDSKENLTEPWLNIDKKENKKEPWASVDKKENQIWANVDSKETLKEPWPPDTWPEGPSKDKLQVPQGDERTVQAQSSMDSGCDCDAEVTSPQEHAHHSVLSANPHYQPMSPLSPSQPGGSGLPSPSLPVYYEEGSSCVCDIESQIKSQGPMPLVHNSGIQNQPLVNNSANPNKPSGSSNVPLRVCSSSGALIGGVVPLSVCSSVGALGSPVPLSMCSSVGALASQRGCSVVNYFRDKHWPDPPGSKVTFRIEGDDEEEDNASSYRSTTGSRGGGGGIIVDTIETDDFRNMVFQASRSFPRIPSYKSGILSASSSTASMPMCRICHLPQGDGIDSLISPCRCAGTMQFIHQGCLMKWLEISSKRSKRAPACELCQYQFNRHKKFRIRDWKLPSCSRTDKILHCIFLICIIIMAVSATVTVICFKQDRFTKKKTDHDLTSSEIVTLTCGIMFFFAFFVAMYAEVKARDTLYKLFCRFFYLNETWYIDEYDKRKDTQYNNNHAPV